MQRAASAHLRHHWELRWVHQGSRLLQWKNLSGLRGTWRSTGWMRAFIFLLGCSEYRHLYQNIMFFWREKLSACLQAAGSTVDEWARPEAPGCWLEIRMPWQRPSCGGLWWLNPGIWDVSISSAELWEIVFQNFRGAIFCLFIYQSYCCSLLVRNL